MAIFTGLSALIGGLLSSTFLSSTIGAALLKVAVGIGLSLLSKALAGHQQQADAAGVKGKLQAGGDIARSFIFGLTATSGSLVYANTWGTVDKTPNANFTQVIALADHPIRDVTGLWVNGAPVTVDTSGTETDKGWPVVEYRKDGTDYLWFKWYDGTQTVADPLLTGSVASADRPYESTRVGTGVAYAIVTARSNQELFSGFPTFRFEVQGRKLYDISKDSTAGGSGSHRWGDKATWGGDGDDYPAVQLYNILRGIFEDGTWLYGLQSVTAGRLPAADWIAQVEKCRTVMSDGKAQYLTGGEVAVSSTIADTIERVLTGCQGRVIEVGGVYKLCMGDPGAAVIDPITDGDILSTEEQSFTPFFGLADTINGVSATYMEPGEAWNTKTAPPLYNAAFEAEDGARRLMTSVDMNMVYRSIQVQRIMNAALKEARRAKRHTFVLSPRFQTLEPGDVIPWSSARNLYAEKLFRVDGVADKANLDVTVDVTEVDPTDYDPDIAYVPPVFAPLGPIRPPPQDFAGWAVDPYTFVDAGGGGRRPGILVSADGDLDDVEFVRVQVRLKDTVTVLHDQVYPYGNPATNPDPLQIKIGFPSILPSTQYQVRGLLEPYSGRDTNWSDWLDVTTPNVLMGDQDVYLPGLTAQINDNLAAGLAPLQAVNLRDLFEQSRNIARSALGQDAGQYLDKQTTITEQQATFGTITADYKQEVQTFAGPSSSLAQSVTTIQATLGTKADVTALNATNAIVSSQGSTITAQGTLISGIQAALPGKADVTALNATNATVSSQGTTLSALGDTVSGLSATVGNFSASGLFRTAVTATEDGASATIAIGVSATAGGAISQAALLMSALAGGDSMLGLVATKVYMTDGAGNKAYPFVFSGGTARLENVVVGTLKFNQLSSNNNKLILRGSGSYADIRIFV